MKKNLFNSAFENLQKAKNNSFKFTGSFIASISSLNDIKFNWDDVERIVNATKSHSIEGVDFVNKLPGELERFGNSAVEAYLKGGDKLGKHWSHIKSQKNSPELSSLSSNAILEDGTTNVIRGSKDMTYSERIRASLDNHFDGFKSLYSTPEFWKRTLGNAFEASVYAMALSALDQILINREQLINGTNKKKKKLILEILHNSGLIAAGTLPVSVFLGISLMLIPGLASVLGPIGLLGTTSIGIRLIKSAVDNPSKQETVAISKLQKLFQNKIFNFMKSNNGVLIVNISES